MVSKLAMEHEHQQQKRREKDKKFHTTRLDRIRELGAGVLLDIKSEIDKLRNEQEELAQFAFQNASSNIIEFEVSGKLFRESRNLLNQLDVQNSSLAKLFSGDLDLPTNDSGIPFLNRDSDAVGHMLKHLKSARKYVPKDLDSRELFHIELEHWGFQNPANVESSEELLDQIKNLKQ